MVSRRIRDPELLDAVAALPRLKIKTTVWRITRDGRDPLLPSSPKGRWDDGSFDVLYTACEPDAAKAEIHFHLLRGQPVFPSQLAFHLHEIAVSLEAAIALETIESLAPFGIETQNFGLVSYARRAQEYSPTQKIGEVAHFLECDGLIVPSARWPAQNAVLIMGRTAEGHAVHIKDHGRVDIPAWGRANGR